MTAFPKSGRSEYWKFAKMKGRFRPRLCKNVRDLDTNGTAHHFSPASVGASGLVPTLIRR